jgi:ABC-type multidrug transport system ATPase subunit
MSVLRIDSAGHRYRPDHWALREINLRLDGEILGLVGPNGAGKSTLLKVLATLLAPTEGSVSWDGHDIVNNPRALRQVLGYVPQDFGAYPRVSARELLTYIGRLKGLRGTRLRERIAHVLQAVRLEEYASWRLERYSGGMVRRLGIAQALLNEPRVLVLDEPTAGLDPDERLRFREMLATLPQRPLIILSTHIMSDVGSIASQLALLRHGRLAWAGSPAGLIADSAGMVWSMSVSQAQLPALQQAYRITAATPSGGLVEVRVIAADRPHPEAVAVTPTLEEAYLAFPHVAGEPSD